MPKILDQSYNELVQKAQTLFWMQGYKGTTVKDLASHLDVSPSTIYNKYSKEMLFMDSINYYTSTCSDPFLSQLRESTDGISALKVFFKGLIDALETRTFPRSCLMVNTIVEMRDENSAINKLYEKYIESLVTSYKVVIDRAIESGEIVHPEKRDEYAEFLLGVIFGITVIFKISSAEACFRYVDEQLSLIK
jgi:TetR/AcrR family transcriptional repressor of nem operon